MKRVCVVVILLCGAGVGVAHAGAIIIDHNCIDLSVIPEDSVTAAASLRLLLRHASVGQGIGWGLDCLAGLKPTNASCKCFAPGEYDRTNWVLEARMGDGRSKIDDLVAQTSARADEFDVLTMKYCYIDALGDHHPDWEYYRTQMEQLEAQYPDKRFVWWTIPLTRDGQPGTDAFNALVRSYCAANGKILFDIADIECYDLSGVKQTNAQGNETICQDYTKEIHAGHLNVEGRIRVASALWRLMAAIANDEPPGTDPHTIIYVDDDATGPGDGSSWQTAYKFLQDALADAELRGTPVEVRVAQGIYRPDQGAGLQAGDQKATFRMLNGVTIKGGYAGLGEPDPNAWNPALYETLLWGDLQGNDDVADIKTTRDNSHHIVTADDTDATAVLETVTVTHGGYSVPIMRPGNSWEPKGGVAIHNRAGSPTIRRCTFSHNLLVRGWGAAMLNYEGAAAHLEQCTFQENYGNSALCDHESTTVLTDCRFIENHGTAIREIGSQPTFERCSFTDNMGTGVSLEDGSHATVSNCVFTGNHNAISGDSVLCTDSVFTGNSVERSLGGAVGIQTGTFLRCRFRDNSGGGGGAIYGTRLMLEDCAFVHNSAGSVGAVGCVYADIHGCLFAGNRSLITGAIRISEQGTLTNCTIVGNRSMVWGTVDIHSAETHTVITNCIIRDNFCQDTSFGEIVWGATTISFSCVAPPPWQLKELGYVRSGLMDVDPGFVDPGYWDPNGTPDDPNDDFWVEGDYHLKSQAGRWDPNSESWVKDDVTSPCIDMGDPNSPVGDEPEPNGSRINMGAYGGTSEASKSPFSG